jgi:hypothetical protein
MKKNAFVDLFSFPRYAYLYTARHELFLCVTFVFYLYTPHQLQMRAKYDKRAYLVPHDFLIQSTNEIF